MKKFLVRYHRAFQVLCAISSCLFFASLITGCGSPSWLTEAGNLVPLLLEGALSVVTFIAAISGNTVDAAVLAEITSIAQKVEAGIKNLEALIESYKQNPGDSLLQEIEAAAQLAINDIKSFFQVTGLPLAIGQKITAFAQLILTEAENLLSLIPLFKSTVAAHTTATVTTTLSSHEFKALFNELVTTPTGDETTDLALLKMKKL